MNPKKPYWLQEHYRKQLLKSALGCLFRSGEANSFRKGLGLFRRCLTNSVLPGNLEKYEAIWKAICYAGPRTILDIGSLDGADANELSRIFPEATIHCFEPDPMNYFLLRKNTERNRRIKTHQLAVSDQRGTATFHASGTEADAYHKRASGSLLAPLSSATDWWPDLQFERVFEVEATTIDDWASEHGVKSIDLVWMDVQGAEFRVLTGMKDLLRHTQCIVCEIWMQPAYAGAATLPHIQQFLESEGFYMTRLWRNTNKIDGDALFQRV